MKILSIDPGGSSGWSRWYLDALTPISHIEHGTITGGLAGFLRWWDGTIDEEVDVVIAEDFILDGRTVKPDTTPLEILGALEAFAWAADWQLARPRNIQKVHAPDDLLKRLGLWWPGKGHDRDSARHALAWAKTTKHMPSLRWMYGKETD